MRFVSSACALALISLSATAADGDEALFGLRWGMTVAQVKAAGASLSKTKEDQNLEFYKTSSLPKNISDFEAYSLIFSNGKLVKLWGVSKDISNDFSGSNGKERFETLRSALTQKYGTPTLNKQVVGNNLFKEPDEFYQCLNYRGCGMWSSVFSATDKEISVDLRGLSKGTGYIELTAEAKPQWDQALSAYRARKNSINKDAL